MASASDDSSSSSLASDETVSLSAESSSHGVNEWSVTSEEELVRQQSIVSRMEELTKELESLRLQLGTAPGLDVSANMQGSLTCGSKGGILRDARAVLITGQFPQSRTTFSGRFQFDRFPTRIGLSFDLHRVKPSDMPQVKLNNLSTMAISGKIHLTNNRFRGDSLNVQLLSGDLPNVDYTMAVVRTHSIGTKNYINVKFYWN